MLNVSHKLFAMPDDPEKDSINRVGPSLDKMRASQHAEAASEPTPAASEPAQKQTTPSEVAELAATLERERAMRSEQVAALQAELKDLRERLAKELYEVSAPQSRVHRDALTPSHALGATTSTRGSGHVSRRALPAPLTCLR